MVTATIDNVQTILSRYEPLLEEADRLFQDYIRTHSLKTRCGPTCSECCVYAIHIHFIESYYLQMDMEALEPGLRHAVRLKAMRNIPAIERLERVAGEIEKRSGGAIQDARPILSSLLRLNIQCPLVGEQGGCLVYKYRRYRPPICRITGIPLNTSDRHLFCNINTPFPDALPPLDASRLQEEVAELSHELELLLTGQTQPRRFLWFFVLFPLEKFIKGGKFMSEKKPNAEEQRFKTRRRLLKLGAYSVPVIATILATEKTALAQTQWAQMIGGAKNKPSGVS